MAPNLFELGQAQETGTEGRGHEQPRIDFLVAAGDDGEASFGTAQDSEPEAVVECLVSLLMYAESGDAGGNASGIGSVTFRVVTSCFEGERGVGRKAQTFESAALDPLPRFVPVPPEGRHRQQISDSVSPGRSPPIPRRKG